MESEQRGVWWTGFPHILKTDRECLIKDDLGHYCPRSFETTKGKKVSHATRSLTQGLWLELLVLCHWATTPPTATHLSSPSITQLWVIVLRYLSNCCMCGQLLNWTVGESHPSTPPQSNHCYDSTHPSNPTTSYTHTAITCESQHVRIVRNSNRWQHALSSL